MTSNTNTFDCSGNKVFKDLTVEYDDLEDETGAVVGSKILVDVTAYSAWYEDAEAKFTAEMGKMKSTYKSKLCGENLVSGTCGEAGDLQFEYKVYDTTQDILEALDLLAEIKVEVKLEGKTKETCTEAAPAIFQTASNSMVKGSSPVSVISTLVGAFALVALAGYAWKRRTSSSENDADQRLYTGDIA